MRFAILAALLLLPAANALSIQPVPAEQTLSADVDVEHETSIEVTLRCESLDEAIAAGDRTLVHEMTAEHPGIALAGPTTYAISDSLCTNTNEETILVEYVAFADRTVPGNMPLRIDHTFTVEVGGASTAQESLEQTIEVAWLSDYTAKAPTRIKEAGPQQQIPFEIEIVNHGNARTMFKFELVQRPEAGQVVLPDQLILDSSTVGPDARTSATAIVQYATPFQNGQNSANETFVIRVVPVDARDGASEGEPIDIEFMGRTEGVYVPGPTGLLPLALLGAALLRRRA